MFFLRRQTLTSHASVRSSRGPLAIVSVAEMYSPEGLSPSSPVKGLFFSRDEDFSRQILPFSLADRHFPRLDALMFRIEALHRHGPRQLSDSRSRHPLWRLIVWPGAGGVRRRAHASGGDGFQGSQRLIRRQRDFPTRQLPRSRIHQ
jgi:hypothetical protein